MDDPRAPVSNMPEYTVSEISGAVKRTLETTFGRIRVRGEVTELKRYPSGHVYLSLKDESAKISGIIWRNSVSRLGMTPENGVEVIATGRISSYPERSSYQLIIERMEYAGAGALLARIEMLRVRLAAEGLFDAARKKPLPGLPQVIGVVSSERGAVIQDILTTIARRFPRTILLWPVPVQGEGAAERIAAAIEGFDALPTDGPVPRPDVLIVARGGGSLEDLWAFNEEIVVRAAAASAIPLISAVGHETDTTLIDFASDMRAPTPTAAAEIAVPVRGELLLRLNETGGRILRGTTRLLDGWVKDVRNLARNLTEPQRLVEEAAQRLDERVERAGRAMDVLLAARTAKLARTAAQLTTPQHLIRLKTGRFDTAVRDAHRAIKALVAERTTALRQATRLLDGVSYQRVLDRGFALVTNMDGHAITDAASVGPGMELDIRFRDGAVAAVATGPSAPSMGTPPDAKPKRAAKKSTPPRDKQGTLL